MRFPQWALALVITWATAAAAVAQSGLTVPAEEQFVPQLGDIMNAVQVRHTKLYFAGKAGNWDLAAYESRQLMGSLRDAAVLYSGLPVSNVTTLAERLRVIDDAVGARDSRKFAEAFGELTGGCNACHQSLGRAFIVIKQPSDQPFGDQQFTRKSER